MQESSFCKECGKAINNIDKFCNHCGIELIKLNELDSNPSLTKTYDPDYNNKTILASRSKRLIARIIDGLLGIVAIVIPATVIVIISGAGEGIIGAIIGGISFAIYQYYLLATISQTLGKKFMNIMIIDKNGNSGGFLKNVVLREWIIGIIGLFPVVGIIIIIIDKLFIFREDRRCIHDMIANTKVILLKE